MGTDMVRTGPYPALFPCAWLAKLGLGSRKSESSHTSADPAGFRGLTDAALFCVVHRMRDACLSEVRLKEKKMTCDCQHNCSLTMAFRVVPLKASSWNNICQSDPPVLQTHVLWIVIYCPGHVGNPAKHHNRRAPALLDKRDAARYKPACISILPLSPVKSMCK